MARRVLPILLTILLLFSVVHVFGAHVTTNSVGTGEDVRDQLMMHEPAPEIQRLPTQQAYNNHLQVSSELQSSPPMLEIGQNYTVIRHQLEERSWFRLNVTNADTYKLHMYVYGTDKVSIDTSVSIFTTSYKKVFFDNFLTIKVANYSGYIGHLSGSYFMSLSLRTNLTISVMPYGGINPSVQIEPEVTYQLNNSHPFDVNNPANFTLTDASDWILTLTIPYQKLFYAGIAFYDIYRTQQDMRFTRYDNETHSMLSFYFAPQNRTMILKQTDVWPSSAIISILPADQVDVTIELYQKLDKSLSNTQLDFEVYEQSQNKSVPYDDLSLPRSMSATTSTTHLSIGELPSIMPVSNLFQFEGLLWSRNTFGFGLYNVLIPVEVVTTSGNLSLADQLSQNWYDSKFWKVTQIGDGVETVSLSMRHISQTKFDGRGVTNHFISMLPLDGAYYELKLVGGERVAPLHWHYRDLPKSLSWLVDFQHAPQYWTTSSEDLSGLKVDIDPTIEELDVASTTGYLFNTYLKVHQDGLGPKQEVSLITVLMDLIIPKEITYNGTSYDLFKLAQPTSTGLDVVGTYESNNTITDGVYSEVGSDYDLEYNITGSYLMNLSIGDRGTMKLELVLDGTGPATTTEPKVNTANSDPAFSLPLPMTDVLLTLMALVATPRMIRCNKYGK